MKCPEASQGRLVFGRIQAETGSRSHRTSTTGLKTFKSSWLLSLHRHVRHSASHITRGRRVQATPTAEYRMFHWFCERPAGGVRASVITGTRSAKPGSLIGFFAWPYRFTRFNSLLAPVFVRIVSPVKTLISATTPPACYPYRQMV